MATILGDVQYDNPPTPPHQKKKKYKRNDIDMNTGSYSSHCKLCNTSRSLTATLQTCISETD